MTRPHLSGQVHTVPRAAGRKFSPSPNRGPKAAGERTRRRIAETALALLGEGDHPPTAREIASRAGVTTRLIFHHFSDLGELYRLVAEVDFSRYEREIPEVSSDSPLAARIEETVNSRSHLYESIGHLGSNVADLVHSQPVVADGVARVHRMLRSRLERTFAPELDAAGRRRHEVLSAADTAVSWQVWDYLRQANGLSATAARRVMVRMLRASVEG